MKTLSGEVSPRFLYNEVSSHFSLNCVLEGYIVCYKVTMFHLLLRDNCT